MRFALFCISFISIIFGSDGFKWYREDPGPHFGEATDCRGRRMQLSDQMKEVKCMPRKTLVQLKPEFGYSFSPSMVSINRCDGLCGDNLSCMPVESKKKSLIVRRHHFSSKLYSCFRVDVKEDVRCKCGCNVSENDCNKYQIFMEDDCACECMNMDEKYDCSMKMGMVWNPITCKCTCAKVEEECSTGLEWIPSLCRCGVVMLD
ncbi:vascular endothelial growth factor A-A [Orussus abietinus]|uniref:vascular endothelial growth factor A-A n=1 Tax=Orussus abietinus TaxID=222816 RepID=UPI000626A81D|nr:vascular endothelial growth factor A-A [Orussus abietinus]